MIRPRPAPRNAEYAADVIAELKRDCKSKKARVRMAEYAINIGNYTDEGRAVWRAYLAAEVAA
jgi:hypothetical protein